MSFDAAVGGAAQAMGVDPGAASVVQQLGKTIFDQQMVNAEKNLTAFTGSYLQQARYYFDVNNAYVRAKLAVLAVPYRHKEWERTVGAQGRLNPPSLDINAPDLYLPVMAYITYILVVGFVMGANGTFTPDVLGITASTGLAIVLLEVFAVKLAFYLINGARIPFLDMCACSGYKFLGVTLALVTRHLAGAWPGWAVIGLAGGSIGTFMVKTLRVALTHGSGGFTPGFMTDGMGSPQHKETRKKTNYQLFAVAAAQFPFFWWLCRVG